MGETDMSTLDMNSITMTDETGREVTARILLTFEADDKNYVLVYEDETPDDIMCFTYDDEGNLYPVTDDAELEMCSEVLGAWEEEADGE